MSYFGHRLEQESQYGDGGKFESTSLRTTTKLCVKLPTIAQRAKIVFCRAQNAKIQMAGISMSS
jgi:hypothetical protein